MPNRRDRDQLTNKPTSATLSFFHSTPLKRGRDGSLYAVSLNAEMWARYLRHFDRVIAAMPVDEGPTEGRHKVEATRVDFLPLGSRGSFGKRLRGLLNLRQEVRKIVDMSEAVVARLPSWIGIAACSEARRQHKPYAVEVVGCAWNAFWHHSLAGKVLAPINFAVTRAAVRGATSALYVTDEYLQTRYPTRAPSWSASNAQIEPPTEEALQERLLQFHDVEKRCVRLTTIGALDVRYKGQETVIKALRELRLEGLNVEYHLIGGGSRKRLAGLAADLGVADSVVFHGVVPNKQVLEILRSTDIYVHPSFTEGQPRAVVEAMSVATPVIGANAGGTPENLPAEQIFPPGDVASLTTLIQALVANGLSAAARWSAKRAQHFAPIKLAAQRDEFLSHIRASVENPARSQSRSIK